MPKTPPLVMPLKADARAMTAGLRMANAQMNKFAQGVTKSLSGIKTKALAIGSSIVATVSGASLISKSLQAASQVEQTRVAFDVLAGSAEQGAALFERLKGFAETTPFEFREVAESAKIMLAQFQGGEIEGHLRTIGELSSGLNIPLKEMADLLSKSKSEGKALTEDIAQFAGRGIPIWQELERVVDTGGKSIRDYVSDGKVMFPDVLKALENLTGEGGKFAGLMDKQSQTLGGLWSTLTSNISMALAEIGKGLTETFDLKALMQDKFIPWIKAGVARIKEFFIVLRVLKENWREVLQFMGFKLTAELESMKERFRFLFGELLPSLAQFGALRAFDYFEMFGKNVMQIFRNIGSVLLEIATAMANPLASIKVSDAKKILSGTLDQFTEGVSFDIAERAFTIPQRQQSDLEAHLHSVADEMGGSLGAKIREALNEHRAKVTPGLDPVATGTDSPANKASAKQRQQQFAGAMRRNSSEAISTILKAQKRDPQTKALEDVQRTNREVASNTAMIATEIAKGAKVGVLQLLGSEGGV